MAQMGIARVGDSVSGHCTSHTGGGRGWSTTLSVGTAGFTVDGMNAVAVGDEGPTGCGHTYRVTGGSSVCTGVGGKIVARAGSSVIVISGGTGTINGGSSVVTSE